MLRQIVITHEIADDLCIVTTGIVTICQHVIGNTQLFGQLDQWIESTLRKLHNGHTTTGQIEVQSIGDLV